MKHRLLVALPVLAGGLALACSSDPDRPPVTSSSGTPGLPIASGAGGSTSGSTGGSTSSSTSSSSGSTSSSSGSTSSGGASSGGIDGGSDASTPAACQGVPREGTNVAETAIAAAPPAAGGGKIADGKYYLTLWESYTGAGGTAGPTGEVRRATLLVNGTTLQLAVTDVEAALDKPITAELVQASGSTLTSDEICPVTGRPRVRGYTASAAQLELLETFATTTTRFVYTKQ